MVTHWKQEISEVLMKAVKKQQKQKQKKTQTKTNNKKTRHERQYNSQRVYKHENVSSILRIHIKEKRERKLKRGRGRQADWGFMLVVIPALKKLRQLGSGACWPAQPFLGVPGQWEMAFKNDCPGCPITSMHALLGAVWWCL